MLESSLDALPATTPPQRSATLRHIIDLCMAPAHIEDAYLRARIEETQWEALCVILDEMNEQQDEALALIETHCASWQDAHRRAPAHWIDRVMRGERVPLMRIVRHVDVCGKVIEAEQLENLCQAEEMQHVTILRLDEAKLSTWAGQIIGESDTLRNLRELYLGYNDMGDEAVAKLCARARFDALEVLGLAHTHAGDRALAELATNTSLHCLHTLQLNQNRITDVGVKALAMARDLSALQHLHLYLNPGITDEGAGALRARREMAFPKLREIDLYDCEVSDELADLMSASHWLRHHDDASHEATQGSGESLCGAAAH